MIRGAYSSFFHSRSENEIDLIDPPKLYTVCNHRHPLHLIQNSLEHHKCNGCMLPGFRNSEPFETIYRCEDCDFDLCQSCLDEFREISTRVTGMDAAPDTFRQPLSQASPAAILQNVRDTIYPSRIIDSYHTSESTNGIAPSSVLVVVKPKSVPTFSRPPLAIECGKLVDQGGSKQSEQLNLQEHLEFDIHQQGYLDRQKQLQDENHSQKLQISVLWNKINQMKDDLSYQNKQLENWKECLDRLRGKSTSIAKLNLIELEELEAELNTALSSILQQKKKLFQKTYEERLCIVCEDGLKSILLMPCRHLCMCRSCSSHPEIKKCPICRQDITNKVEVYT